MNGAGAQPVPLRFLVVEDSHADFLLLASELRRQHIHAELRRVESRDALEQALSEQDCDLVIADYHVPGLAFSETLELAKTLRPGVPVLIHSGEVGEDVAVDQLKNGAADFVLKDRPARLGQVILRTLAEARNREAQEQVRRELEASQEQLRLAGIAVDSVREGIVMTDARGDIISVNPAFTRISGMSGSSLVGQSLRSLPLRDRSETFYKAIWQAVMAQDHWQGEIWFHGEHRPAVPLWLSITAVRDAQQVLINYVALLTDISRLKRSEARLDHMARHDPLTDLPNRVELTERLRHAINRSRRGGQLGAVLFIDLDRFKDVNDSLGHPSGDLLLVQVGKRLRRTLRQTDILARLGGDEFVVVLEDLGSPAKAADVAQHLITAMQPPFRLGANQVFVGISIGISIFPAEGSDPDQLVQHADAALYQAKSGGRGIACFYTTALTEAANERLRLEVAMRKALEEGHFELFYQPILNAEDGQAISVEALVRWQDGEHGMIMPDRFIPLAEDTGFIIPLGEWIMGEACRQFVLWQASSLPIRSIAINLSPRQFRQADIAARTHAILTSCRIAPECVMLEITESAIMEHGSDAIDKLRALRQLGIQIAIDDFGIGYSSLAHIQRFPIDTLKIDKSFVQAIPGDATATAITSLIIAMGKILDLQVQAEGVETNTQLAYLHTKGCHTLQGFLFSKPLPAHLIPHALSEAQRHFHLHDARSLHETLERG